MAEVLQPHLPAVAVATLQSILDRPDAEPGGLGLPGSGWRRPGGPGGPEAGTSAILAGERTTLHPVPSLPPARGPEPAPRLRSRTAQRPAERARELGSPGRPEPCPRGQGEGGGEGEERGERGDRGTPEGGSRRRSARQLFKYSGGAARSRRHGNACPSNRTEWLSPGNTRDERFGAAYLETRASSGGRWGASPPSRPARPAPRRTRPRPRGGGPSRPGRLRPTAAAPQVFFKLIGPSVFWGGWGSKSCFPNVAPLASAENATQHLGMGPDTLKLHVPL